MRFQLLSDLHLEFCKKIPNIIPKADYLILAGDIGYPTTINFTEFMKDVCSKFKRVFFVAGNHEYYDKLTKYETDILLQKLSTEIGFEFLNNKTTKIDDLTIIGSTLWTKCNDIQTYNKLKFHLNDYNKIKKDNNFISPFDTGRWHYDSVNFLEEELKKDGKKLIITHHLPSYKMINEKYINHSATCGFATNIEHLFGKDIVAWCCGHTHEPFEGIIQDVACYINPIGYPNERKNINYEFTLDISN